MNGEMSLQEAIDHLKEKLSGGEFNCDECKNQHKQLLGWLEELKASRYGKQRGKIENPESIMLAESVHIISDVANRQYYLDPYSNPLEEPDTLQAVETWFKNRYGVMPPCMVISESYLDGCIYRYGNYGDYWEVVGSICGFA